MTERMTDDEQREENYLHKVANRNAAHAAAVEAERRAADGKKKKKTMAQHVAGFLRRLYALSALLLMLEMAALYVLYIKDGRASQRVVRIGFMAVVLLLLVKFSGWLAAYKCSVNGARLLFVINVALTAGLALLLDEVVMVWRSHVKLQEALLQSVDHLSQDVLNLILNGGTKASLVQRFIFDAPGFFLQWLSTYCSNPQTSKIGYQAVAIDRHDFFARFWNKSEKSCVNEAVERFVEFDEFILPVIIVELVMISIQIIFTGMFLAVSSTSGKKTKRRWKLSPLTKLKQLSKGSTTNLSTILRRLLIVGSALFGSSSAIASTHLLEFCSIVDFHSLFTWLIAVCLLSGFSAILAALFVGCGWKQRVAGVLLSVAVALEVFMLAELVKMAAKLIVPNLTAKGEQERAQELREVYLKASSQTCSSIEHWISHVCVGMSSANVAEFDLSCQHEFEALLMASFNFTNSYLACSIGVKLILLVQLIVPILRQAVSDSIAFVRSYFSGKDSTEKTEISKIQTSLPIVYKEAYDIYEQSIRVRDPDRLTTEANAFEKEWSRCTGRALSDVSSSEVVIATSDFGAIVRSLVVRRLQNFCKLDLNMSVSEDGHLLLVRICASDNLLLATLCETETYRLQFADAIDPGRSFWRDKKEVATDQKVLDANTVKHKLKLLLVDSEVSPKEAVRFPGESLPRVSARIHALARISRAAKGLIRCLNPAPAFASYSPSLQRQFIFKRYPHKLDVPETHRRSAVLRTVDCIRVTRRIINAEIDVDAMISSGLLSSFHCLHSSSRFDYTSRGALASSWVTFWRPVHLPGEFCPKDHAIFNLLGRIAPFRQPIQQVRDYFGEFIGFYFAWFAFYAKMMVIPALFSIVLLAGGAHRSLWKFYISPNTGDVEKTTTIPLPELLLGIAVIAWSFALVKSWERRSIWYQLQWGVTTDIDSVQQHCFELDIEQKVYLMLASIQRQLQLWKNGEFSISQNCSFSRIIETKLTLSSLFAPQVVSWLGVVSLGLINLLLVLVMLLSQGFFSELWGEKLAVIGSCVCQALLVQWNSACLLIAAQTFSKWEYPQLSREMHPNYQSSVVAKLFALQVLNTFTGLILLLLSRIGWLEVLVHVVSPLHPLYVSYASRIEGNIGVFIQMETLIIALFAVQLSIRVLLVLSAIRLLRSIQRAEQRYIRQVDETMLSQYPGPHKDYAQIAMQLGLVVMFSSVCPLLPLLALIDCAVKLRQNALELCCVRQRPEPEGIHSFGDDDAGLGLWAPYIRLILKFSVPVALGLALFAADNFYSISTERRVGYWLLGVLGTWLAAQLLWFLIPRESRLAEEARARNEFLVERYFGGAEVNERKATAASNEQKDLNLQESAPSPELSLSHYERRLELLHRLKRLDAAVKRKRRRAKSGKPGVKESEDDVSLDDDESRYRERESSEEMIVGYFRPVRGAWAQQEEVKESPQDEIVSPTEEPLIRPPRRGSAAPGKLPVEEIETSESVDEDKTGSHAESGESETTERPTTMPLSKLFKRSPASDGNPQVGVDTGVFTPTSAESAKEVFRHDLYNELLEEKKEELASADEENKRRSWILPEQPAQSGLSKLFNRQLPAMSPSDTKTETGSCPYSFALLSHL
ncbi:Anoctamin-10 [Phytophthora citrophthora]|uniref:Anoctamin-10 n=1 Tax=Phytophthora citrophthora TaxID=4793 RepID=A0AAD9GLA5_9STRA|nr:Anoctamin-10 [Phytophthora citrophthora]